MRRGPSALARAWLLKLLLNGLILWRADATRAGTHNIFGNSTRPSLADGQELSFAREETMQRRLLEAPPCDEYTLCGKQVLISSLQDDVDLSSCLFQSDMELWLCGEHMLSGEAYDSLYNEACLSGCLYSPEFLDRSISSSPFYWEVGEWGACTSLCGGGTQTRHVRCRQIEGNQLVANSNCAGPRPPLIRVCNQIACEVAELAFSAVSAEVSLCSETCGGGLQERPQLCADSLGYLVSPELCPETRSGSPMSSCNLQPCASFRWQLGQWSSCSEPCGGGYMERSVQCFGPDNTEVDVDECPGYESSRMPCNTSPCSPGAWDVSAWGECVPDNGVCGVGTMRRSFPNCFDKEGRFSMDCRKPGPAASASCVAETRCEACEMDCHGHGSCQPGGVCLCGPGRRGQYCEIDSGDCPAGLLDRDGMCCPSGVLDRFGACCTAPVATLDRDGLCCLSGKLDKFGVCGGDAKYVDIAGHPCSGLLDAAGVCCESSRVDDCGVCEGHGASCGVRFLVSVLQQHPMPPPPQGPPGQGVPPAMPPSLRLPLPEGVVARVLLGVLGIEPSQLTMESAEQFTRTPPPDQIDAAVQEGYRLQFRVSPPLSISERAPLSTGEAALRLANAEGSAVGPNFFLGTTTQVVRMPICGNGVCEVGERALADAPQDKTTCIEDCGHAYAPCPAVEGFEGERLVCGGRGVCHSVAGICACFRGHRGAACEKCAPGFVINGGICVFQSTAQSVTTSLGSTLTASVSSILLSVGAGAGVSVFIIVVYTVGVKGRHKFWKWRRQGSSSSSDSDGTTTCSRLTDVEPRGISHASGHQGSAHPPSEASPHGSFARGHPSTKSKKALEELLYRTSNADPSLRTRSSPIGSAPNTPLSAPSSSKTIGRMLLGKSKLSTRALVTDSNADSEPVTPTSPAVDPQTPKSATAGASTPTSLREMINSTSGQGLSFSSARALRLKRPQHPLSQTTPDSGKALSPMSPYKGKQPVVFVSAADDSVDKPVISPAWTASPVKGLATKCNSAMQPSADRIRALIEADVEKARRSCSARSSAASHHSATALSEGSRRPTVPPLTVTAKSDEVILPPNRLLNFSERRDVATDQLLPLPVAADEAWANISFAENKTLKVVSPVPSTADQLPHQPDDDEQPEVKGSQSSATATPVRDTEQQQHDDDRCSRRTTAESDEFPGGNLSLTLSPSRWRSDTRGHPADVGGEGRDEVTPRKLLPHLTLLGMSSAMVPASGGSQDSSQRGSERKHSSLSGLPPS